MCGQPCDCRCGIVFPCRPAGILSTFLLQPLFYFPQESRVRMAPSLAWPWGRSTSPPEHPDSQFDHLFSDKKFGHQRTQSAPLGHHAGTSEFYIMLVSKAQALAQRMKKKKPHTVPLSPQAMAILEKMKPYSHKREHTFPGERNPRGHIHPQSANMAIKRMGLSSKMVAHGMRSLASTTLNEEGFDADIIEAALAHADTNDVRSAYNRAQYIERRTVMMRWWSTHIEEASTDSKTNK